jgi:hypothetical protein
MNSNIRHAETDCLENLGRTSMAILRECVRPSEAAPLHTCSRVQLADVAPYGLPSYGRPCTQP